MPPQNTPSPANSNTTIPAPSPAKTRFGGLLCVGIASTILAFMVFILALDKPNLSVVKAPANQRVTTVATIEGVYQYQGRRFRTSYTYKVSFIDKTGQPITTTFHVSQADRGLISTGTNYDNLTSVDGNKRFFESTQKTVSVAYLPKNPAKYIYLAEPRGALAYWTSLLGNNGPTYYMVLAAIPILCMALCAAAAIVVRPNIFRHGMRKLYWVWLIVGSGVVGLVIVAILN